MHGSKKFIVVRTDHPHSRGVIASLTPRAPPLGWGTLASSAVVTGRPSTCTSFATPK
jgi:hypothetical protein